jgi:hypothetical protein
MEKPIAATLGPELSLQLRQLLTVYPDVPIVLREHNTCSLVPAVQRSIITRSMTIFVMPRRCTIA